MRFLFLTVLAVAIALGLGTASVVFMLERFEGADALVVGPWHADRTTGSPTADPYAKARLARSGNLTLGLGEGVAFQARVDTANRELRRECAYRLEGAYPPARVWTLAAFDNGGRLIGGDGGRPRHLVSLNLMREDDNSALISIGREARPGNWLANAGTGPFVLALTFYDTPVSTDSGAAPVAMPLIVRTGCLADG
ncbi:DUF1214 domain-containing protein [Aureimonas sp. AU4]|uniref:DUF1214 domain-containing protein n=1 Tax=Aureimonas sp. AU4 TaxID=1638163 RepID=UPI0007856CF6|nr:DUF1214 domain-containing protein [Aureimonas sp. AU4]